MYTVDNYQINQSKTMQQLPIKVSNLSSSMPKESDPFLILLPDKNRNIKRARASDNNGINIQ